MKKIVVFLTAIILLQTGSTFAQEDALIYEDDGAYPVQASLYPTLQLAPYDRDVTGIRLNIIGVNRNMPRNRQPFAGRLPRYQHWVC